MIADHCVLSLNISPPSVSFYFFGARKNEATANCFPTCVCIFLDRYMLICNMWVFFHIQLTDTYKFTYTHTHIWFIKTQVKFNLPTHSSHLMTTCSVTVQTCGLNNWFLWPLIKVPVIAVSPQLCDCDPSAYCLACDCDVTTSFSQIFTISKLLASDKQSRWGSWQNIARVTLWSPCLTTVGDLLNNGN